MEPARLFTGIVLTIAVMICVFYFCQWWYAEYYNFQVMQQRYFVSKGLDTAIFDHKALFVAAILVFTTALVCIWMYASGYLA